MTVDTEWLIDFFRRQARLGFEEGDYTRTRNSCRELLQYVPDDTEALTLLGDAALASHDSVVALRSFDQLLELQPDSAESAMKLGQACLQAQDWPAAVSAFKQVLELQPEHVAAHEALALIDQLQARLNILGQGLNAQPKRNDPCPCGSGLKYKKCCLEQSSQLMIRQRFEQAFAAEQWQQVIDLGEELQQSSDEARRFNFSGNTLGYLQIMGIDFKEVICRQVKIDRFAVGVLGVKRICFFSGFCKVMDFSV